MRTSARIVTTIGIRMPDDFPVPEYDQMHRLVITRKSNRPLDSTALSQFQRGWNAVAYRFRATAEHDEGFTRALSEESDAQTAQDTVSVFEIKHLEERELFGFFVTGFSVLESFAYSMFAVGSMVNSPAFPMQTPQDRRKVSLLETQQRLLGNYPSEQLATALQSCLVSPDFQQWKDIRNTLTHRASPPRLYRQTVSVGAPTTGVTSWDAEWPEFGVSLNETTTSIRRSWLAATTEKLLKAANEFGRNQL